MKKVLIVDDEENWRVYHSNMVRKVLAESDIVTADNAQSALSLVMENIKQPFDIIITDLQMESLYLPKYAGEWLVEQIKSFDSYYKIKIVIISGSPRISAIANALNVDYIRKTDVLNGETEYKIIL